MEEDLLVCKVCSLPTPKDKDECLHCGSPLRSTKIESHLRDLIIYTSIAYFILLILKFLVYAPEMKVVLSLMRLNIIFLALVDVFFVDRSFSIRAFNDIKRFLLYRMHKWIPYLFYENYVMRWRK